MGLRVNSNIPALRTLRLLEANDRAQARSLERLSTGLRINRASDDPAGLVAVEQLRGQIGALNQSIENIQSASNLIGTADAALQEVSDLLIEVQDSVIFALNGSASPTQIAAEQAAIDQSIDAINRIAGTTRFGDRSLLNGTNDFVIGAAPGASLPNDINDLKVRSIAITPGASSASVTVAITTTPLRGAVGYTFGAANGTANNTVIRVTGPRGTEDINLAQVTGLTAATSIADSINGVAGNTGVFASGVAATGVLRIFTEEFGTAQNVRIEMISGAISATAASIVFQSNTTGLFVDSGLGPQQTAGEVLTDLGRDAIVRIDGQSFTGTGRFLNLTTSRLSMEFALDPDITLAASVTFTVANRGLNFQIGELPRPSDRLPVGIEGVTAGQLGNQTIRDRVQEAINGVGTGAPSATQVTKGGFLTSMRAGGANDLDTSAGNAQVIINGAIDQVSRLRAFLGGVQASQLDSLDTVNQARVETLSEELSNIRDLNFAAETTAFTRTQILFQAGIASLASANLIPQSILTLLG